MATDTFTLCEEDGDEVCIELASDPKEALMWIEKKVGRKFRLDEQDGRLILTRRSPDQAQPWQEFKVSE